MILSKLKNLKEQMLEIDGHEKAIEKNERLIKEAKYKTTLSAPRNLSDYYQRRKEACRFGPTFFYGIVSVGLAILFYIVICCLDRSLEWDILFTPGNPLTGGLIAVAIIFGILIVGLYATAVVIPTYFIDKAKLPKREKEYDKIHAQALKNAQQADEKILSQQRAQLQKVLDLAETQKKTLQEKIAKLKEEIANERCIPDYYKTIDRLTKIISYFEQGRAETVKEALNLFAEETRYQQIVNMQRQANAQMQANIQAVQQIAEEARSIAYAAENTAQNAQTSTQNANITVEVNGPSSYEIEQAVGNAINKFR